ncbi:hypothetical protein LINPERHAP2_LOCUS5504 [Linum perenne]
MATRLVELFGWTILRLLVQGQILPAYVLRWTSISLFSLSTAFDVGFATLNMKVFIWFASNVGIMSMRLIGSLLCRNLRTSPHLFRTQLCHSTRLFNLMRL